MEKHNTGILLSGGMDSIAIAYWKRPRYAFTINYGQRPAIAEIQAANQVCKFLGIEHHVISVDCSQLGTGDMSENEQLSIAPATEWWPYRNQLLVTLACMKGVSLGITELYVGAVSTDVFHKDGTKGFYSSLSTLMQYQEGEIVVTAPAIDMNTVELIEESSIPSSVLLWAHSCHTSNNPCMNCNGCKKYLYTLQALGID
ncbi:MAG: 7-cyano-7-deazaguanine synthase [Moheibacter sp.]